MSRIDDLRAAANAHAKQLEAVHWHTVADLAVRWGVSVVVVRRISREKLPYLTLGGSRFRRYDPSDVLAFEAAEKRGNAA